MLKPFIGNYRLSYGFGYPPGYGGYHAGNDYATPVGTQLVAAIDGRVIFAGFQPNTGAGNAVSISDGKGTVVKYFHMSRVDVPVGKTVKAGDGIGLSGNTGNSKGAHLHFQVEINGKAVDPTPLITQGGDMQPSKIPDADNYYWRYSKAMNLIRARDIKGAGFSREEFRKFFVGQTDLRMLEIMSDDAEANEAHDWMRIGYIAVRDGWEAQIVDLTGKSESLKNQLASANETIKQLQQQLANQGGGLSQEDRAAIQETKTVVNWIKDAFKGIFNIK